MNLLKKLFIIFLLLIVNCFLSTCKKPQITFAEYLKSLDSISLPFKYSYLTSAIPKSSIQYDTLGFKKYNGCNCSQPVGILLKDGFNIVIINLSDEALKSPIIVSYDNLGNKIDSLNLREDAYQDINSEISPYLKILKKRQIVLIDTLRHWENDKLSHIKPGSTVTQIDSTIYNISKNGKFIQEKPKK